MVLSSVSSRVVEESFDRDGFVHVESCLSQEELGMAQRQIERYKREIVPELNSTEAFYEDDNQPESLKQLQRMDQHDEWFSQFALQTRWLELAEQMLRQRVVLNGVEWFNKPKLSGKPTPPHQDGFYFCLKPDEAVTFWFAIDRVDEENGCLRYARGSHLGGIRPHGCSHILGFSQAILDFGDDDRVDAYAALMKPGDMVAHHSRTIHWADGNASNRSRQSLALVFFSERAQRDDAAYNRYQDSVNRQHSEKGIGLASVSAKGLG